MLIKKIVWGVIITLWISGCSMSQIKYEIGILESKDYNSDKPLVLFILDTSGSMNQLEGKKSKLLKAKESITNTINQIDKSRFNTSLITFDTHITLVDIFLKRQESCKSQVLVPPSNNTDKIIQEIEHINAYGKTPLANALSLTNDVVKNMDKKMIILLSDGQETCGGNPFVEAEKLYKKYGIKVNLQVIGYAVDQATREELQKISRIGKNWSYYDAKDINSLNRAIDTILTQNNIRDSSIWVNSNKFAFEFSSGSISLKEEYLTKIYKIYDYLKQNNKHIIIVGYTDSVGSAESNLKLSLQRARMVESKLIELGMDANRIQVRGEGESNPIASNDTKDGRRENRRVEIDILD
jgi:OOP family OmpA-OmpF porin